MIQFRFAAPLCLLLALGGGAARAAVLTVGSGLGDYATLGAAVASASAGDTINVDSGTYTNDGADIAVPLTITGVDTGGGLPVFTLNTSTGSLFDNKGFLVIDANTTIDSLILENAAISSALGDNGAGIRYQSGNLTVTNSSFVNDQNGILGAPATKGSGIVLIQNSTFTCDGLASGAPTAACPNAQGVGGSNAGLDHAIYIGNTASLTVTGSIFSGTQVGHDIKSRAAVTLVTGNSLEDGATGSASYAVDLPDGGNATISGNTITQGPGTGNSTMISYGEELGTDGAVWTNNGLTVLGNLFDNTDPAGIAVDNLDSAVTVSVTCNAFNGSQTQASGLASLFGNVVGSALPSCANVPEPPGFAAPLAGFLVLILTRFGRRSAP